MNRLRVHIFISEINILVLCFTLAVILWRCNLILGVRGRHKVSKVTRGLGLNILFIWTVHP